MVSTAHLDVGCDISHIRSRQGSSADFLDKFRNNFSDSEFSEIQSGTWLNDEHFGREGRYLFVKIL